MALIAGGSAGLGLVIARTFLSAGYHVVIAGRDPDRLNSAADALRSSGCSAVTTIGGDMTDRDQADRIVGQIDDRLARIDVLVNCIGVSDRGVVEKLTAEQIHTLIERNVIATLHCSQAALPMLKTSGGTVVNIGSLAGKVTARYLGGYNVAKHALTGLTGQMRLEWRKYGVHVALVSPGPIRRDDAGARYADRADDDLPAQASAPGGGTRVKGLDPQRVADAVLKCVRRRQGDVVLPRHLRLLIAIGHAFPRLGDWLLLKFTSPPDPTATGKD